MSTPTKEEAGFEPAVTFEDVWMGFDEGPVLRGVTFQVQQRETLILLGETGTGKTLTLKMGEGLLIRMGGRATCSGMESSRRKRGSLRRFGIRLGLSFREEGFLVSFRWETMLPTCFAK